ncbi:unnamed protein product [Mytilus edulis]|uniref:Uncharacterized protein n=1 Tax=Mytilus edulis TaxID=6550 RepID=A0A8S3RU03_MYTED|nr:unnamed protein product [Mytilus edulis]
MWMIVPGDSQYRSFHSPFTEYSSVSSIKCATVDMYNQDTEKTKIPLKIFTHDRRIRKGVFASSFADMVNKCKEKFTIAEGNHITFVLNEDGVEIDDEFFSTLTPNTILMILNEGETWNKQFDLVHLEFQVTCSTPSNSAPQFTAHVTSPATSTPISQTSSNILVHAGTPTVTMQLPNTARKCIICADREIDAVIQPCFHSLCLVCGLQIQEHGRKCPICRGNIENVRSIFYC